MPTKLLISGLLLVIALAAKLACAQSLPPPVEQALRRAHIPLSSVAAYVQAVDGAKPLLAHNAAQAMNPASTIKLLTTYAALELLGPAYAWKTEAYASGNVQGDALQGDLILKGYGDPKLTLEKFWLLLRRLRALGLREIRGSLVLDRSYFEPAEYDPAKFDAEPLRAYNVGPDALLLNFKAVRFLFQPDAESKSVTVVAEPRPAGLEFAAAVRATDGACGDWRAGIKADFQSNGGSAKASFSGSMPASCGEHYWNVSLLAQPDYVYGVFRQLWEELGGTLAGGRHSPVLPAAGRRQVARRGRILEQCGTRARHQQVQQQRHGAPVVSHPWRRIAQIARTQRPVGAGGAVLAGAKKSGLPGTRAGERLGTVAPGAHQRGQYGTAAA